MRGLMSKSVSTITSLSMLAGALLIVAAQSANGQAGPATGRPSPGGPRVPESRPQPSIRERQFRINEMEREATRPRTPEEDKIALAQIAEDFERIQTINNKMMSAAMRAGNAPDFGNIARTTAEIRKRADRMKDNLRLPTPGADEAAKRPEYKKANDVAGLKAGLLSLDRTIMSFVKSPIFQSPGVVDVEQVTKARRDLDIIISFSQLISKDAEELGKSSEKKP